jgi:hypothetical protein
MLDTFGLDKSLDQREMNSAKLEPCYCGVVVIMVTLLAIFRSLCAYEKMGGSEYKIILITMIKSFLILMIAHDYIWFWFSCGLAPFHVK